MNRSEVKFPLILGTWYQYFSRKKENNTGLVCEEAHSHRQQLLPHGFDELCSIQ